MKKNEFYFQNKQIKQVQNNTNININKLNDNFEYNQKVLEETQKSIEEDKQLILAQKRDIEDLNSKIIHISKLNALTIKGKFSEDEVSKSKINQCEEELKTFKAEMDLKFHMQNELVNQYNTVESSFKTIINQLSHFQDKIDDIQNQIELSDNELTQDKLNQLTNCQSEYQNKFNNTIKSLENIKINNKDIEENFKKQVNTIKESISKYQLSLSDKTLQFEYKKLVEKHPKTTKFFTYTCKNNNVFLSIKDPKYSNIVNKLILKSYENLWDIQTGLNEPTVDNLSYYIDGNFNGWESSSSSEDEGMDEDDHKKEKSFIGNTTLIDFQKQLENKLISEINKNEATSSNKYEEFNNKINNIQSKLSTDLKKEYENLNKKLQMLDINNKDELNEFKQEFKNIKDLFSAQEKAKQEINEINRQLKDIKHEKLRERQKGNYKEKAKLDYTYNTIDFSESYDSFIGFLNFLEKENIQENQYYNSLSGKTYEPNERDRLRL